MGENDSWLLIDWFPAFGGFSTNEKSGFIFVRCLLNPTLSLEKLLGTMTRVCLILAFTWGFFTYISRIFLNDDPSKCCYCARYIAQILLVFAFILKWKVLVNHSINVVQSIFTFSMANFCILVINSAWLGPDPALGKFPFKKIIDRWFNMDEVKFCYCVYMYVRCKFLSLNSKFRID